MDASTIQNLLTGFYNLSWQGLVMIAVGILLIYLAIAKEYEPLLLLPIGAGCLLANMPISMMLGTAEEPGMLQFLYDIGVGNELFPLLIFIGIGAMTDFGPLLENPKMVLLGAAGQFGIFLTLILALLLGFTRPEAASIGIIGAIDGPTSIYVSAQLAPHLLGPITVAAYSYMSLVPIIMPPVMRLLTTQKERSIRMPYSSREISQRTRIMFPIVVTIIVGILVPFALPLIGTLMLGNLMRESKVVERLSGAAQNELNNIVTLFLGLAIGSTMVGQNFIKPQTLFILVLGLLAFCLDTAAGVLFGKLMNLFSGGKFNPLIGAAGISAFPMAARVVQKEVSREDNTNFVLMHAMGANAAGQVASAMAGGVVLALMAGAI
ncbi:MAG: sodium ion-translocating decarboxylase subunit beta [Propionibacteriaceae bacterium]|jgi:oxaloacetate decarboxylase beta subunit|uniref:Sodium ion-translocating decarboxylase subunit beta n=1 Tax=Brooklawnia propionicigenes TaxID=3041175 RepID=A0AAN0ME68_9ACTN|nr:sodium ion-translocating decarboxylase subunit beta [Brooklawnia sp. SH051]MCB0884773.1 sodium ion-translocating decarboxylase subunit beta [Propionibacteriaceae bacterium]MEA5121088.1 sodium ion-translocating decarboxylase subunit beta [Propionibacterium sp.]NLI86588.1 sodium ion-translocating decarboxylase subunit beta [Propionibacterium sp.]BEH00823.1 sodium ion-translocating decarboxylase subunit beta [Brooklawnia sp. SH051]